MQNSLTEADTSEIIEMALSDHTAFSHIRQLYGLEDKQVKALMRKHLKPASYRAWRKRVHDFGTRREHYK
ncbi:MAG: TIGR03643 family protein [Candidatus Puniceispirillaceae bacterium]